jgi:hypothetical protein
MSVTYVQGSSAFPVKYKEDNTKAYQEETLPLS